MTASKAKTDGNVKTVPEVEFVKKYESIVVFRAKKPLTQQQHEALSQRIRFENEKTGLTIILAPGSIDEIDIKED